MLISTRNLFLAALACLFLSTTLTANASADESEIKYRQGVMKAVGGTMGSLAAVLKNQAPTAHAVPLADIMKNLATVVPDVFPASSDFGETAALPAIWEKPAEFKAALDAFVTAANALPAAAAAGGDTYGTAFANLGKACKDCHEHFREKKEK